VLFVVLLLLVVWLLVVDVVIVVVGVGVVVGVVGIGVVVNVVVVSFVVVVVAPAVTMITVTVAIALTLITEMAATADRKLKQVHNKHVTRISPTPSPRSPAINPCSATVLDLETDNRGLVVRNACGCIVVHEAQPCRSEIISAWRAGGGVWWVVDGG
jgi:hypothetical protein